MTPSWFARAARRWVSAAVLLALCSLTEARAQADDPTWGAWYSYTGTATIGTRGLGAHAEVQHRNHRLGGDLDQLLVRGSLRYTVPDRSLTGAAGYALVHNEATGTPDTPLREHRIYQEVVLPQRVLRASVTHRFRYEQRFVGTAPLQTRYRYNLGATLPLSRRAMAPRTVFAAASAEAFLRGDGRRGQPVYDRARVQGALGYRFSNALAVQAGALGQLFESHTDWQVQLSVVHTLTL